uniref:Uncharacterized protein n=1 Tax=Meloidogyne floridensis TaxID=298350 RepID=A0A915P046_9BILA
MHSHMSRVSSKQERMMLTEQESSPTGGILEQLGYIVVTLEEWQTRYFGSVGLGELNRRHVLFKDGE